MTHEQLIAECFQWWWNNFEDERRMLFGVNNNVSAGLSKAQQILEGNKNKAKGVTPGVFDFIYFLQDGQVACLDGKVGNDVLSKQQLDFAAKCKLRGHLCFTFSSLEEFQDLIFKLHG